MDESEDEDDNEHVNPAPEGPWVLSSAAQDVLKRLSVAGRESPSFKLDGSIPLAVLVRKLKASKLARERVRTSLLPFHPSIIDYQLRLPQDEPRLRARAVQQAWDEEEKECELMNQISEARREAYVRPCLLSPS